MIGINWRLWLVVVAVMAGLGGANVWQFRHAQALSGRLGEMQQSNTQLSSDLVAQREQVARLTDERDREASIREQRDQRIRHLAEQMETDRREWRAKLGAAAGDWMATDIPDVVDQRLCDLVPCASGADGDSLPANTQ